MKRFSSRELVLLFVPCIALFAYAYYLSIQPKEPRLVLDRFEVKPSTLRGYDTEVKMYMYARGPWPQDLLNPGMVAKTPGLKVNEYGFNTRCELLYEKNGKTEIFKWPKGSKSIIYYAGNQYDTTEKRFYVHCVLNLAAIPPEIKPLKCRMRLKVYDYQKPDKHLPFATAEGSFDLRSTT